MWNKSDCNCEFIFENCIKDETEFKKKSFFAGYYTHLLTDRLYSRLISMPIEEEFGKYREHPGFSKLVKREWYDADFKFFAENKSPAFEDFMRSYIRTSRILIISLQKRAKSFWKKCTKTA